MATDKKSIIDIQETVAVKDAEVEQRKKRKRRFIIILSSILIATTICVLVTSIVLFSLWTSRIMLQEKEHKTIGDKEVDQELYKDTVDALTYYHIVDGDKETWFILDYNRMIEIMKVKSGDSSGVCYVAPFDSSKVRERNQTTNSDDSLSAATPPSHDIAASGNESLPVVSLRASSRPITEKSILGKRGQGLCQDVDTFWILSSADPLGGSSGSDVRASRVRRAAYTWYSCYFDWTICSYYSFSDKPYVQYYGCQWTCGMRTYYY